MFSRNITKLLINWKSSTGRKPLVIRGARQVGKTSAVHQFGSELGKQIVGQTLLAMNTHKNENLYYWYREQKGVTSKVDYLIVVNDRLVPVEVKSGKTGTLRSLHNFMDESKSDFAIRIYSGNLSTERLATQKGKKFKLFSIPFYLLFRIRELL
jgi:uncharacterized protein